MHDHWHQEMPGSSTGCQKSLPFSIHLSRTGLLGGSGAAESQCHIERDSSLTDDPLIAVMNTSKAGMQYPTRLNAHRLANTLYAIQVKLRCLTDALNVCSFSVLGLACLPLTRERERYPTDI